MIRMAGSVTSEVATPIRKSNDLIESDDFDTFQSLQSSSPMIPSSEYPSATECSGLDRNQPEHFLLFCT